MKITKTFRCSRCKPGLEYPSDIESKFCMTCERYHKGDVDALTQKVRDSLIKEIREKRYDFVEEIEGAHSFYQYYKMESWVTERIEASVVNDLDLDRTVKALIDVYRESE